MLDVNEFLLTPIYLILIFIFIKLKTNESTSDVLCKSYVYPALIFRFVSTIIMSLIYIYYYGYGDTFTYFSAGKQIAGLFHESIFRGLDFLSSDIDDAYRFSDSVSSKYLSWENTFVVAKITGVLCLFTFNSYLSTSLLMSAFAFLGLWKLYLMFAAKYPDIKRQLAYAILFVPSTVQWSSIILKDTITLGLFAFMITSFYTVFFKQKKIIKNSIFLLLQGYFLFKIKAYILLALIPCLILWLFFSKTQKIKNIATKFVYAIVLIPVISALTYFMTLNLASSSGDYAFESLENKTISLQHNLKHITDATGGSGYSLGEIDYSLIGMFTAFPKAVNVTLFRPYPWEIGKIILLIPALESLFFLLMTLYLILKNRIKLVKLIDADLSFCIFFSLIFAFAVGLTAYNFGTLVRYKIPMMPLYATALVILNHKAKARRHQ